MLDNRAEKLGVSNDFEASVNIVIFHVKVPPHATKINTPDIKGGDQSKIDYEGLLEFNIKTILWAEPQARVILLTDHDFVSTFEEQDRVKILRLSLNTTEPMFERVMSMASYVRSRCFSAPTVFLDIDAFLIRPISGIFRNDFDVGLTHVILLVRCQLMKVSFWQTLKVVMQLSNFLIHILLLLSCRREQGSCENISEYS